MLNKKIKKELDEGKNGSPFVARSLENLRVSPFGLVPKKTPNEYRMIHHLSYPEGSSVNDFIDTKLCSVQYTSFDAAVEIVQELGQGCLLGKSDIKSAFRLLPVNPDDFELLGFKFKDKFYFDKCMPFGCSISCSTFEKFACFLEFAVKRHCPIGMLIHFLDDFFYGGRENTNDCAIIMNQIQEIFKELGVPLAVEKTEGPKTCICFVGLEIDSIEMVIRMPIDKVNEIILKIEAILCKEKVTLKIMQSLIGSLNFACKAIIPGRPFCRRLINAICGLSKPHHHLRVTSMVKKDLNMWLHFFKTFNGVSVFHDRFWVSNVDVELFTDSAAAKGLGFGAYFAGKWTYGVWPELWHESGLTDDITVLELFPLLVSLYVWGEQLRNKKILFHCDNYAVVHIISKMSSKSENVMVLLRNFTLQCMNLNVVVKAVHVSGVKNKLTDSISRLQFSRFHMLAPHENQKPDAMPDHLWHIFNPELENC